MDEDNNTCDPKNGAHVFAVKGAKRCQCGQRRVPTSDGAVTTYVITGMVLLGVTGSIVAFVAVVWRLARGFGS